MNPTAGPSLHSSLSARQTEIAALLVSGKSTREIALALVLSPRTVETHVAAIYNKYGVSSRVGLTRAMLASEAAVEGRSYAYASRTNLPPHRSALVGRETDIANVVDSLHRSPLVTITGSGGIGKTRTALAVGEAIREATRDGVWLVELAPIARPSLVADAVGRALSVRGSADVPPLETLVARLKHESLLLVLDNCEHVIGEAAVVADALLRACPSLRILATSREPLRISGEQTYRLTSLRFPTSDEAVEMSAVRGAEFAAIELFAQRARAVDRDFELDDDNARSVAEICRRLDGIPLAIELAAARVNILPVASLGAKLDRQLRLLSGGDRTASPRHRTMHALIDWSYDLLSHVERRLFERLSAFSGGCALPQAAVIFGGEASDDLATLETLSSLVDKSLVAVDFGPREPRYALLQSFRWYASEKLAARGESSAVSHLHAVAYVALAEEQERQYDVVPNNAWFTRAKLELDNFRAVLAWTLEARRDALLGQRLAAAMRPLYASAYAERHWLELARNLVDEDTPAGVNAHLEYAAAWLGYINGEWETTTAACLRLIDVFEQLGEPLRAAQVQTLAAKAMMNAGHVVEGESLIAKALETARSAGSAALIASICSAEAQRCFEHGELSRGRAQLAEALTIYESIGAEWHAAALAGNLAEAEFRFGNFDEAETLASRALITMRKIGSTTNDLYSLLNNLAAYRIARDRWADAHAYAREVIVLAADSQHSQALTWALQHLAAVAVLSGRCAGDALARSRDVVELLGYVDARIVSLGFFRGYTEQQEYDRTLRLLRETDGAQLEPRLADGRTMTHERAIELALSL
jgi:predicted ATPase/DNA-binding CsgD family transcriptional regulator